MIETIIKKKKKGFTLIELIAVIAILAILGAILVPKITGYSDSAKKAKAISDAKIIVNAAAAYNADHETAQIADTGTFKLGLDAIIGTGTGKVIEVKPSEFAEVTTLAQLKVIAAAGKDHIILDSNGMVTSN
ncbi:type II secretion system GspH family protein [Clostridium estertheticum]|uniref:type II secretion system protein n=1 Tax=Clostridium estertheticum TaxID=238834 RepID=UPI0013EEE4F7|nr:prepilin-type N-terminal cleavage/methylation domain-containing protein [Clostridium estertheticum]MBZ9608719.1 type II secretion system GspH family protein [Clostridium estertheticum]